MSFDFSHLNLQYLIQARDLVGRDREQAGIWLGMPDELVRQLPELSPQALAKVLEVKLPLLAPRQETWWWSRLFVALQDGQSAEIKAVLDQASLIQSETEEQGIR